MIFFEGLFMKRFLYFVLVMTNVIFSGEALYDSSGGSDVACYKHAIPELVLDCKLKSTKGYEDVKKDGFLVLKMREVQSSFNKLIIHTRAVRNAIGSGKMKEFLPYFFQGLPPTVQYRNDLNDLNEDECTVLSGSIAFTSLFFSQCFYYGYLPVEFAFPIIFLSGTALTEQYRTRVLSPVIRCLCTPYFYYRWKKERKEQEIVKRDFEFVTDKNNTLLSGSFEDLIVKRCFDVNASWYLRWSYPHRKRKTLCGSLISNNDRQIIQDDNLPGEFWITIIDDLYYKPDESEFYHIPSDLYDTIIDIFALTKHTHFEWHQLLHMLHLENWFEGFKKRYNFQDKRILLNIQKTYRMTNLVLTEKSSNNLKLLISGLKELFENEYKNIVIRRYGDVDPNH